MKLARLPTLLLLIGSISACSPPSRPNLLLISLDTTRADHLSVYGYDRDTTPNLRRLAAEGARFVHAYSASSSTGPSHASLFTSRYPGSHGILKNGSRLDAKWQTLAEILMLSGYQTHGIAGSFVLHSRFGYAQGFDAWEDDFDPETSTFSQKEKWRSHDVTGGFDRPADETTQRAIAWLEETRSPDRPFFLFLHYFDPHHPYLPPSPYDARFGSAEQSPQADSISAYDGEIAFTDAQIGLLLEVLNESGLAQDTLVAVTGDHGEGLMQRGHPTHGIHIYEEIVRVPLLLRFPRAIPPKRVFESPIASVDLLPTLLELLLGEAPQDRDFQGQSFAASLMRGGVEHDLDRPIYLTRRHYADQRVAEFFVSGTRHALRVGRWKYFEASKEAPEELYDLVDDPGERVNLAGRMPARAAGLSERLTAWRGQQDLDDISPLDLSDEERQGLEALGYAE